MSGELTGALLVLSGVLVGFLVTIQVARAGRKDALRLAAVERRLAAHQEAYALWCGLLRDLHNPDRVHEAAVRCQSWWRENCLYLDPKSRREFWDGSLDAAMYHDLKGVADPRETFARLRGVLDCLVRGVDLPTVEEHEFAESLREPRNA